MKPIDTSSLTSIRQFHIDAQKNSMRSKAAKLTLGYIVAMSLFWSWSEAPARSAPDLIAACLYLTIIGGFLIAASDWRLRLLYLAIAALLALLVPPSIAPLTWF